MKKILINLQAYISVSIIRLIFKPQNNLQNLEFSSISFINYPTFLLLTSLSTDFIKATAKIACLNLVLITLILQPQTFTLGQNEGNLCLRQDVGQDGVEDLTELDDLHEASLLWNLRLRYDASHFYTYVGSILVSINPYTLFPDLYGLEMAKKYAGAVLGKFKYLREINFAFLFKYFFNAF